MKNINNLVTKKDLQEALTKTEGKLHKDITRVETKFDNKFDEVITRLDAVMGELQTIREEFTIHFGVHEDVENRLQTLEKSSSVH